MQRRSSAHAFVACELLAIIALVVVLMVFLALGGGEARRRARVAGSISNLQAFAAGVQSFGADRGDRVVSFSWRAGEQRRDPDGYTYPPAADDMQAAANQAVSIMRRFGHRIDLQPMMAWLPHLYYTHLALTEHLGRPLPAEFVVSPSDHNRLAWQRAGRVVNDASAAYFALRNRPEPGSNSNFEKRWPYSSSYEFGPCFYSPDRATATVGTVSQGPTHRTYFIPAGTPLGDRRLSEVAYPASKAMVYETYADDGARRWFFAYERVRTPILFADGSASVRSMSDANRGFDPSNPGGQQGARIGYAPEAWEPPTASGAAQEFVWAHIRWTREGLPGRDFGGSEVQR